MTVVIPLGRQVVTVLQVWLKRTAGLGLRKHMSKSSIPQDNVTNWAGLKYEVYGVETRRHLARVPLLSSWTISGDAPTNSFVFLESPVVRLLKWSS